MEKKSYFDAVASVVAKQLNVPCAKVKPESRIVEDLHADSLDIIDMLMTLEEEHGVVIPDDVATGLKTVGDVAGYLDRVAK